MNAMGFMAESRETGEWSAERREGKVQRRGPQNEDCFDILARRRCKSLQDDTFGSLT